MLTIIVPVFNKERYIKNCLDSICGQTHKDIQIILVDDGSTDGSGEICDYYAKADARISVVHKTNQGLVSARIEGMKNATGEFVAFVDADDWIDPDMYRSLLAYMHDDVDFVTSGMVYENNDREYIIDAFDEGEYINDSDLILSRVLWDFKAVQAGILPSMCNKVFRKEMLENTLQKIDRRIGFGEDRAILYSAILDARKFVVTHGSYYHYRLHEESMCHSSNATSLGQIELLWRYLQDCYINNGKYEIVQCQLERNLRELLDIAEHNALGINNTHFVFPFNSVSRGSKIVLYGIGNVGKSFLKYIITTGYVELVAIADKYSKLESFEGIRIIKPDMITALDFDCVLVANNDEAVVNSIFEELCKTGLSKDKIVWTKPTVL